VTPAVDDLLRGAAADPELQPLSGDEVRSASILEHIKRIFITHVDDAGADFDPLGSRPDGRQQRKRRSELPREVMNTEIRAVRSQVFRGDRKIDRLLKHITGGARRRTAGRRPMSE